MKKEYIILALVILALSAYLVFKKENQPHFNLPLLAMLESGKIDKLLITQKGLTLELFKDKESWGVTDQKFPADMPAVNNMLDTIQNLKISALISEKKDVVRYELDQDHGIEVKAFQGDTPLREFKIGKTAPSFNHTFVMMGDDTRIYQADKSFTQFFNKSLEDMRDKQVLKFPQASIQKITLEKERISKTLTASAPSLGKDKEEEQKSWKFEDGSPPDKEALTNLLASLSFLACQEFSPSISKQDLAKRDPLAKITLENETPLVLMLFKQDKEESMLATSSMSPYAFVLESFKAEDILSYVDKLTGLEKKEKSE